MSDMFSRASWGDDALPESISSIADNDSSAAAAQFAALQQVSSSLQFHVLFALLDKRPLRLQDGLDIFRRLDVEQGLRVSAHELLEECTRSRTCSREVQTTAGPGIQGLSVLYQERQEGRTAVTDHLYTELCADISAGAGSEEDSSSPSLSLELFVDRKRAQEALQRLNHQQDGMITLDEWKQFLAELLLKDLHFSIEKAWASGHVYFAHQCSNDMGPLLTRPRSPPHSNPDPNHVHKIVSPAHTNTQIQSHIHMQPQQQIVKTTPQQSQQQQQLLHHQQQQSRVVGCEDNGGRTAGTATGTASVPQDLSPKRVAHQDVRVRSSPRHHGALDERGTSGVAVADSVSGSENDDIERQQMHSIDSSEAVVRANSVSGCSDTIAVTSATETANSGVAGNSNSFVSVRESNTDSRNIFRYDDIRRTTNRNARESRAIRGAVNDSDGIGGSDHQSLSQLVTEYFATLVSRLHTWTTNPAIASAITSAVAAVAVIVTSVLATVVTAVVATVIAAAEALRGLLLGPWRRLESALHTSFLGNAAWRADFLYYEKNMNPVLGLFCCDPHHPLTFLERLDIEFCVYGWVFFSSALFALTKQAREQQHGQQHGTTGEQGLQELEDYKATNANKYIASFLLVSAPSMLLRVVLFYMFLCPCIVVRRKKKRSLLTKYMFPLLEGVGRAVGVATFLCSLFLYGFGLVMTMSLTRRSRDPFLFTYAANWLLTNCVTYVVWDFCIYFNPFLCCAPTDPDDLALHTASAGGVGAVSGSEVGDSKEPQGGSQARGRGVKRLSNALIAMVGQFLRWVGLAQWQLERRRARDRLRLFLGVPKSELEGALDGPRAPAPRQLSVVTSKSTLSLSEDVKKLQ